MAYTAFLLGRIAVRDVRAPFDALYDAWYEHDRCLPFSFPKRVRACDVRRVGYDRASLGALHSQARRAAMLETRWLVPSSVFTRALFDNSIARADELALILRKHLRRVANTAEEAAIYDDASFASRTHFDLEHETTSWLDELAIPTENVLPIGWAIYANARVPRRQGMSEIGINLNG